ncbi:MAG: ATP-binding protein [Candidatus Acidifodinimicrobium sp.]
MEDKASIGRVLEILEQYEGVIDRSEFTPLIERYLRTKDTEMRSFLLSRLIEMLERATSEALLNTVPNAEEDHKPRGEFVIGEVINKHGKIEPFTLSREDLNRNVLIIASVGHGKTSLIKRILKSLFLTNIKYIVFDIKKDYVSFGAEEDSFYLDSSSFRINVLAPPSGVSETEWAMHVADVFSHSFSLLVGSRDFLLESIINLYKSWKKDYPPSLSDLARYIESGGRNEYARVVLGRIKAVLASTSIFDCNIGLDLSKMERYNLFFGIDRLGMAEQSFLASFVILYLYHLNMNDASKRGALHRVIVIDDAHTILDINKERDQAMGVPLLHTLISKMRELGVGFIFADQQISSLLSSAIQNSNTKFIGSMNLMKDLSVVFDYAGVNDAFKLISKLKIGEFLVLSQDYSPYGVMRAYKADEDKSIGLDEVNEKIRRNMDKFSFMKVDKKVDLADLMIHEVIANPFKNLSVHRDNLNISKEDFDSTKSALLKSGLLYEVCVKLDEHREAKFLYPNKERAGELHVDEESKGKIMNRSKFVNQLLKKISESKLKEQGINFESDEVGILLHGLKTYIVFMHKPEEVLRLMETPFRRIINVLEDSIDETDAMVELIKVGRGADISPLRFCHAKDLVDTIKR